MTAVGKNLERFRVAIASHDRENPTHTAYGIALARFDMERLGFDDGEELWPGITIHSDDGQTAMLRVLCDGSHEQPLAEEKTRGIGISRGVGAGV